MLIIYSEHITNRLQFIVTTLFGEGTILTNDSKAFSSFEGKKINYSTNENLVSALWIKPVDLLFEKSIFNQDIECFLWNNLKVFYKTEGNIPFDFLAASFYLLTRYEEYSTDFIKDEYGNFHHENSVAWKEGFLHLPIIHLWLKEIEKEFGIISRKNNFNMTATYDVDISFAYQNHPWSVKFGGLLKDLVYKRGTFKERLQVLFGYKKDPYQIFSWLNDLHKKHNLQAIYFFLVAQHRSKFDKNPSLKKKQVKQFIQEISKKYAIGIHPSFQSNGSINKLKAEIKKLSAITDNRIIKSRQHYLQLQFPSTYKTLIQQGIQEDYTLGYGTQNGFRASYCYPFYWYDLENDTPTKLLLHPFCFMDANFIFEQKLQPQEALVEMKKYYETVKSVDGDLIFIMHNHFLAVQEQWKDWRKIYVEFLQFISVGSSI